MPGSVSTRGSTDQRLPPPPYELMTSPAQRRRAVAARQAHNLQVVSSNLTAATNNILGDSGVRGISHVYHPQSAE